MGVFSLTFNVRQMVFGKTAEELDMHVVYDVSHNICKVREREFV